ncbi:MAG: hypothetical protein ACXVW7_05480 [Trebonia sp.]
MNETYPEDLVRHVAASTGLSEATATRVVADVKAYFSETVEAYIRRRHAELKDKNWKTARSGRCSRPNWAPAASGPRSSPNAS